MPTPDPHSSAPFQEPFAPGKPPVDPTSIAPLFFRRLMESVPDLIYFKDTESRFLAVSDAHARALGLSSPEQAIGKTDFDFSEKSLARQQLADEREIMRTGSGFVGKEERARIGANRDCWVVTSKQPLFGASGEIIGTFGISRDITEMKTAREALEAHHRLLETLIEILPCRIFVKDDEGRIRLTNAAYREAVGLKNAADIEGRRLDEIAPGPRAASAAEDDEAVLENGCSIINREEFDNNPVGRQRWMLVSKVPLRDAEGQIQGIVGMLADITEPKEAEARAVRAQRELATRNQQMEADLAVARELQTELMNSSMQSVRDEIDGTAALAPRIAFRYEPCEYLAGDFFQAVPHSPHSFGLLLCDVMGHGVKAALITTLIRGLLSDVRTKDQTPAQVLEHLNERLCPLLDRPPMPRFVTALYATIDFSAGRLRMASAGHPWPLLHSPGSAGGPITRDDCGPALGFLRGATYTSSEYAIKRGDQLLLYTDGWTEAANASAEEFGTRRLLDALARHTDGEPAAVLAAIAKDVSSFAGTSTHADDICSVLVSFPR